MKLKITKIFRSTKDKKGNLLKTKDGREYERVAIKAAEFGDVWVSGFGNRGNSNWNIGDEIEVEIEKINKDGKEYLNFSSPNIWAIVHDLERRIGLLEEAQENDLVAAKEVEPEPEDEPEF